MKEYPTHYNILFVFLYMCCCRLFCKVESDCVNIIYQKHLTEDECLKEIIEVFITRYLMVYLIFLSGSECCMFSQLLECVFWTGNVSETKSFLPVIT